MPPQLADNLVKIQRFPDMSVHAGVKALFDVLPEHIGGHCDNGNVFRSRDVKRADMPRSLVTVHFGHLYVHKYHVVFKGFGLEHFNRLYAVLRTINIQMRRFKQGQNDLAVDLDIFHKQNRMSGKIFKPWIGFIGFINIIVKQMYFFVVLFQ